MRSFQARHLLAVLNQFHQAYFTGVVSVEVTIAPQKVRSQVIASQHGAITDAGSILSNPIEFFHWVGGQLQMQMMNAALQMALRKVTNFHAIRTY